MSDASDHRRCGCGLPRGDEPCPVCEWDAFDQAQLLGCGRDIALLALFGLIGWWLAGCAA